MNTIEKLKLSWRLHLSKWLTAMVIALVGGGSLGYAVLSDTTACRSANATSSVRFMTPGTGTTTTPCATANADSVRAYVIVVASSSGISDTVYGFRVERSMNNIDWFADVEDIMELATTTRFVSNFSETILPYASSTAGTNGINDTIAFGGYGTTTYNLINFDIPTAGANYVRLVSYITTGSRNGAIHQALIPKRDTGK